MRFKIKAKPEDFIVEEIASLPLAKKGDFAAYLLQKRGWNTVDLLLELSRKLAIPFGRFSYGGKKDRHSLSTQYIAIKNKRDLELSERDYSLKFIGFMARPMGPDLIQANHFKVIVRNLIRREAEECLPQIQRVQSFGYANYFDDQRFGSFDARQGFLAEKALRGQFNGAIKVYLTAIYPQDTKEERKRKRFFFENWKDWSACREKSDTRFEEKAFNYLADHPRGFLDLLKQIPREELSIHIASLQSYLWNQMLKKIITTIPGGFFRNYPGLAGEYIFYSRLSRDDHRYLSGLNLPVPGSKPEFSDELSRNTYAQVLENEQIREALFNKWKLRQAYLKSFQRPAIAAPQDLGFSVLDDEVYPGKRRLLLEFRLPRGSYATMFLKRIFSEDYKI